MRPRKQTSGLRCVICGTSVSVQRNHVGGQHHVAWFWMPFCQNHHDQFHVFLRNAGINLEYTSDPRERILRALQACLVAQWMLTKALQELNSHSEQKIVPEESPKPGETHV